MLRPGHEPLAYSQHNTLATALADVCLLLATRRLCMLFVLPKAMQNVWYLDAPLTLLPQKRIDMPASSAHPRPPAEGRPPCRGRRSQVHHHVVLQVQARVHAQPGGRFDSSSWPC